jgi:hypothetical protein
MLPARVKGYINDLARLANNGKPGLAGIRETHREASGNRFEIGGTPAMHYRRYIHHLGTDSIRLTPSAKQTTEPRQHHTKRSKKGNKT